MWQSCAAIMSWVGCLLTNLVLSDTWKLRGWNQQKFWEGFGYLLQIRLKKSESSVGKQPTQLIIAAHNCHKCYPFRKYPTTEDILDPAFIRTSVLYTWVFEENNVLCGITLNQVILSHWIFVNYPSYFTGNFGFSSLFWPKMPNSQSCIEKWLEKARKTAWIIYKLLSTVNYFALNY